MEKPESSWTADKNVIWYNHSGNQTGSSWKFHSYACTLENCYARETRTWIFIAMLVIITRRWKTTQMSINWQSRNKKYYIHTMEYYSAVKGILYWYILQYGWQVKSQTQKVTLYDTSHMNKESIAIEGRLVAAKDWGQEKNRE